MDYERSEPLTTLTTHVLDIATGRPAAGISITLVAIAERERHVIARATTNADGRTDAPLASDLDSGTYELVFAVGAYFAATQKRAFFTDIPIRVTLDAAIPHHHIPLLLAPHGYSTYRGS